RSFPMCLLRLSPIVVLGLIAVAAVIVAFPEGGAAPLPDKLDDKIELRLGKGEVVQKLCLSPDNHYLAAALHDGKSGTAIDKWNLRTEKRVRLVQFKERVVGMAWPRWAEGIIVRKEYGVEWYDSETGKRRAELDVSSNSYPLPLAGNKVLALTARELMLFDVTKRRQD